MTLRKIVKKVLFKPGYRKYRVQGGALKGMWFYFDLHADTQAWRGIYEQPLQTWLTRYVQTGNICLDIGGADGYFALLMAKLAGPQGEVHTFEPSERTERIQENFNANTQCALAKLVLYSSCVGAEDNPAANTVSIDRLVDEGKLSIVNVIKIDVDGAEMDVLHGMRDTLRRFHPHLFVEVHSHTLREQVNAFTKELGYSMRLEMPPTYERRPIEFNAFYLSQETL